LFYILHYQAFATFRVEDGAFHLLGEAQDLVDEAVGQQLRRHKQQSKSPTGATQD
jgi:hypothetical protein